MQPDQIESFLETGIITPERMRVVDKNAIALGVTELQTDGKRGKVSCRMCNELESSAGACALRERE